jgi:anaerobic dimethyl sulfoxide reductase subunit B (iron-sulfur subunit)
MKVCSAGAIKKRDDGIVYVDRGKCQSLKSCITACPFAGPGIADDRQEPIKNDKWIKNHPMQKCNMCMELIDKGEQPVCVRACPMRAIEVGDYDELIRKHNGAEQLSYDKHPYAYINNKTYTNPSFIIKPRKKLIVEGSV